MVLVDTSVWVAHLRSGDARLKGLLEQGLVACHPFVVGELACGNLGNRKEILGLLQALPQATVARHDEVLGFLDVHKLMARGLGYVDIHLLASARLDSLALWTLDSNLKKAAERTGISFA